MVMQPDSGFFCEGNSSDDDVVLKEEFRGIIVKQGCLLKQVSVVHVPSCPWDNVAWIQDYSFTPKSFREERNEFMPSAHLTGFISVPLAFPQRMLAVAWQQGVCPILQYLLLLLQNKPLDSFN